jgi:hypothetical protein
MLPPGTFRALKGHPNGIVTVAMFAMAAGLMAAGVAPWPVVALLAIALLMFHIRCSATERHVGDMAQRKVDEAAIKVEATKARYRALLSMEQPSLDLTRPPGRIAGGVSGDKGATR